MVVGFSYGSIKVGPVILVELAFLFLLLNWLTVTFEADSAEGHFINLLFDYDEASAESRTATLLRLETVRLLLVVLTLNLIVLCLWLLLLGCAFIFESHDCLICELVILVVTTFN